MVVIARAYRGRPFKLFVVRREQGCIVLSATEQINENVVGFPTDCVYQHDGNLFNELHRAWQSGDAEIIEAAWRLAQPARIDEIELGSRG